MATTEDAVPAQSPARTSMLRRGRLTRGVALGLIVGLGLILTATVSVASWSLDRRNEHRLLVVQARQGAALISSAVVDIVGPLQTAGQVANATGGDAAQFSRAMQSAVGPGRIFVAASLWQVSGGPTRPIAAVGVKPFLTPTSSRAMAFIGTARRSKSFVVTNLAAGANQRIGYALAAGASARFIVYAERAIPANRQVPVEQDAAFADLRFATYLGTALNDRTLATTNVPPSQLPLSGHTVRLTVPFGNSVITLVAGARGHLGGGWAEGLPWILLGVGVGLTATVAGFVDQLLRRSRTAERDSAAIGRLYEEVNQLYQHERSTAETLQRAILPRRLPELRGVEIATRYVAGGEGVEVGGDWFTLVAVDGERFGFAVGDVSGRGVSAASIMAKLRYCLYAYLAEGHSPEVALQMCASHIDIEEDGHFATVLVGTASPATRQVTLANAGHMPPLLVGGDGSANFIELPQQLPLGIGTEHYETVTFAVPTGATLLCYTDGLVERRGESLDDGLRRLADGVADASQPLEGIVDQLLRDIASEAVEDDTAIFAFRWSAPIPSEARLLGSAIGAQVPPAAEADELSPS